jgi:hypothetical protein
MALKYESNVNPTYLNQLGQQYGLTPEQLKGVQGPGGSPLAVGNTGFSLFYDPTGKTTQLQSTAQIPAAAPIPAAASAPRPASAPASAPAPTGLSAVTGSTGSSLVSQTGNLGGATAQQAGAGSGTIQTQFRDALLGQLSTNPNNVKLTDADLAPQVRAYQDAQDRQMTRTQRELAEQGFASGMTHSGAYDTELAQARQQQGESTSKFNADLLSNAKKDRMAALFQALGIGGNLLTSDASLKLQEKLGMSDIDLRRQLGTGQLSLGLLQALLGDRANNNQLGLSAAQIAAGIDQNSMNRI